ncbi:MAG TPA: PilZ domain-containing protein [Chthonomonadaceae bacterium]|nr:PilZ domain-containing protein [Chthonomonadaceae bacterium]
MRLLADNRNAPRTPAFWPLRITDKTHRAATGRVLNASLRGLCFQTNTPFHLNDSLELEIQVGPGYTLQCVAHIVRRQPGPNGVYVYGAEFDTFHANGYSILQKILKDLLKQEWI